MRGLLPAVAAAVLLSIVPVAASAGLVISGEAAVSQPVVGAADLEQTYPSVAGNGEMFLAAWAHVAGTQWEIYAARVSRSGEVLDWPALLIARWQSMPTLLPIPSRAQEGGIPRVAWNGREFLIAWSHASQIFMARVSTRGDVAAETVVGRGGLASLTCNPGRCLAVFIKFGLQSQIAALMLDQDGRPVLQERLIAPLEGTPLNFATATDGDDFLVTWSRWDRGSPQKYRLHAASISGIGRLGEVHAIAGGSAPIGTHAVAPRLGGYLLSWAAGTNLTFQQRTADGAPDGTRLVTTTPDLLGYEPLAMIAVPEGHLLIASTVPTHERPARLIAATIGGDMSISPSPLLLSDSLSGGRLVGLASSGDAVLAVWPEPSATVSDIHGRILRPQVRDERIVVSQSARPQRSPAAAFDGEHVLTVWEEVDGDVSEVRGALSRPGFTPAADFAIAPPDQGRKLTAVAFDGNEYLVVWSTTVQGTLFSPRITARRLSRSGEPVGDEIVVGTTSCGADVSVASDGRDFVVLWTDCSPSPAAVIASFIESGMVAGNVKIAELSKYDIRSGAVAWGGQHYLTTWTEREPKDLFSGRPSFIDVVSAARLTASGVVLDPGGIVLGKRPENSDRPEAASNGDVVLVVWADAYAMKGAVVRADGTSDPAVTLFELELGSSAIFIRDVSVAWAEPAFVLAWTNAPYRTPSNIMVGTIAPSQLARGTTAARAIPMTDDAMSFPIVVGVAQRKAVLAYQRLAHEPEYGGANRVFLRSLQFFPRGRAVRR